MHDKSFGDIQHPTEEGLPCVVLQYADDTLIVLRGDLSAATILKTLLD
jgi:hypothetical protein